MLLLLADLTTSGCDDKNKAYKKFIDEAYSEANTIANTAGVKSGIDWNSAPAVDFFGPPRKRHQFWRNVRPSSNSC